MSKKILFPQSGVVQIAAYFALPEFVMKMGAIYDGTVDYYKSYPQI